MSYTTQDRYNVPLHSYNANPSQVFSAGTGKTWWPDFGPNIRDFSYQENCDPSSVHFKSDAHRSSSNPPNSHLGHGKAGPGGASELRSFRRPAAPGSDPESRRRWAKDTTARQSNIRELGKRQKVMDSWIDNSTSHPPAVRPNEAFEADSSDSRSLRSFRSEGDLRGARRLPEDDLNGIGFRPMPSVDSSTLKLPSTGLQGDKSRGMRGAVLLSYRPSGGDVREAYRKQAVEVRFYGSAPTRPAVNLPQSRYVLDPSTCLPVPRVVAHLGSRTRQSREFPRGNGNSTFSPEDLAALEGVLGN